MKSLRSFAVLVAASTMLIAACTPTPSVGTSESGAEAPASADSGEVKIGFAMSTLENPFFVSMKDGIDEAQKESGVEILFADAGDDANKQANDILDFIAQGVDVAVLNPTDGDAIVSSVEALNQAGIPVITVDRISNGGQVVAHIGTDNVTAGEVTAKTLFDAMGGKGTVAILEGVPGASSAIDRGTGFQNVLKDYPDIEVVATQTANYQRNEGLTVAQNILQANPDLTAFLSMNDEMALGAAEAIAAAGRTGKTLTIGIDGGADAVKAVSDGTLVATVAQQSKLMGSMGILEAIKVAQGESVEKLQPVEVLVIDEKNVAEHLK
ncbi:substrate-binding domain-containing protein [Actinomyces sp. B33]|uniref:substrate-binding domain-containing protein n=1 Tax=Actinomyces sp. B33 TaxID=2942131 RepID=UPI002341B96E|nr:substrate-binding domain-containing protein [Actinomyces sp. B33]MDC4233612.1 substrate-binding domain-containing protein [Actinomyces sp. B33]